MVHFGAAVGLDHRSAYGMKLTGERWVTRFQSMSTSNLYRLGLLTAIVFAWNLSGRLLFAALGDDHGKPLFNGKDLSGWVVMNDAKFSVTNGVIHLDRSTGWLRTEKEYTDFVLVAQWRALETNYNSGFYIRAGLVGTPYPTNAFQVNLKEMALGELLKGKTRVVESTTKPFPVGEWVEFRMEARGKILTLDVNGQRAWEYNGLDTDRGCIGIQAESKLMEFRNVRVRELRIEGTDPMR